MKNQKEIVANLTEEQKEFLKICEGMKNGGMALTFLCEYPEPEKLAQIVDAFVEVFNKYIIPFEDSEACADLLRAQLERTKGEPGPEEVKEYGQARKEWNDRKNLILQGFSDIVALRDRLRNGG
jgi:hypothetical protein